MKSENLKLLDNLAAECNAQIRGIDQVAKKDTERAYGGIIRAGKGGMVEFLCKELVKIAWNEIGGKNYDLFFSSAKIPIPLNKTYLERIKILEVRQWIEDNYKDFVFNAQVDIHVFIKNIFALGVECKAYTENAMLKRILVDFTLLKTIYPTLKCALLQLESQLTGDYSHINQPIIYGSHSTHTLLSYFDIDLHILTLLEGERKIDAPIHKEGFFKSIERPSLENTIKKLEELLLPYRT